MVDYRDELNPHRTRNVAENGGAGGALLALLVVVLGLIAIFWYAGGSAPDNSAAAPAIGTTESAPAAPEATPVPVQ